MRRVMFFGVRPGEKAGHFLHDERMRVLTHDMGAKTPWKGEYDALAAAGFGTIRHGYLERHDGAEPEGVAHFARRDGWALMALWDRSADKRGGCCALFFVNEDVPDAQAASLFRVTFERVFERIEAHLGRTVQMPLDELNLLVEEFRFKLGAYRGKHGRDAVRKHRQGALLDALDAGRAHEHPDDFGRAQ